MDSGANLKNRSKKRRIRLSAFVTWQLKNGFSKRKEKNHFAEYTHPSKFVYNLYGLHGLLNHGYRNPVLWHTGAQPRISRLSQFEPFSFCNRKINCNRFRGFDAYFCTKNTHEVSRPKLGIVQNYVSNSKSYLF